MDPNCRSERTSTEGTCSRKPIIRFGGRCPHATRSTGGASGTQRFAQVLLVVVVMAMVPGVALAADDGPLVVARTLSRVPRTVEELAAAHTASEDACREIAPGEQLDAGTTQERITYRVTTAGPKSATADYLPYLARRVSVMSFGLEMSSSDQAALPLISGGIILGRIQATYVSVQVRVHRAEPDGEPYLHYRPLAAMATYGDDSYAVAPQDLVAEYLSNVRGLGLFVREGEPLVPANLRTLVAANKCTIMRPGKTTLEPFYDLLFVRARFDAAGHVTLHSFGTKDERRRICYLPTYAAPRDASDCSVRTSIFFTDYTHAGQYPVAQASRAAYYNSQSEYTLEDLDRYAAAQGWKGDALANLNETLDAIIDGRLEPSAPVAE
jgi:hypothetical protein